MTTKQRKAQEIDLGLYIAGRMAAERIARVTFNELGCKLEWRGTNYWDTDAPFNFYVVSDKRPSKESVDKVRAFVRGVIAMYRALT